MNTIVVSASSSNHVRSLQQFLRTVPHTIHTIVYDIGLLSHETHDLRNEFPRLELRTFHFDAYPPHVRLTSPDAGAYAWKPILIAEVCREYANHYVLWCDAGNKIYDLPAVVRLIQQCGVYSSSTSGTVRDWTHPQALLNMVVPGSYLDRPMRNAACVGMDTSYPLVRKFVDAWRSYALNKDVILPEGANRSNHRHDQSILTYLMYSYGFPLIDYKIGYTIHNDID